MTAAGRRLLPLPPLPAHRRRSGAVSVEVNGGAMDDPAAYPPRRHSWCQSAVPRLVLGAALPRFTAGVEAGRAE